VYDLPIVEGRGKEELYELYHKEISPNNSDDDDEEKLIKQINKKREIDEKIKQKQETIKIIRRTSVNLDLEVTDMQKNYENIISEKEKIENEPKLDFKKNEEICEKTILGDIDKMLQSLENEIKVQDSAENVQIIVSKDDENIKNLINLKRFSNVKMTIKTGINKSLKNVEEKRVENLFKVRYEFEFKDKLRCVSVDNNLSKMAIEFDGI